jgi:hypothetical protein
LGFVKMLTDDNWFHRFSQTRSPPTLNLLPSWVIPKLLDT